MVSARNFLFIGVLLLAAGCTNLQAVNTASAQLASAASSWNVVADQFEASCHRRNRVSDVPSTCAAEKQATVNLEAADKLLSAYFTALQQASSGANFSIDPGISAIGRSVQSIPGANAAQMQAVAGLAKFLADAATLELRERTLGRLINGGAPKAIDAIDVFDDIVVTQLTKVLDRETNQTLAAFNSYVQQSGATADLRNVNCTDGPVTHGFSAGNAFLLAEAYCSRITAISQQKSALANYQKSLAASKNILQELQAGKDDLGATAIIQQLVTEAASLSGDIDKIHKAF